MRAAWVLVALGMTLSCRPEAAETRSANYASDRDRILREAKAKVVMPLCKGDVDGYRACGLIVFDFRDKAAMDKFDGEKCADLPANGALSCFDLYKSAFMSEIRKRYDQANEHEVKVACASEYDCAQWEQLELAWLGSHNSRVFSATKRELAARGEQDDRDRAEVEKYNRDMRAAGAAFAGAAAGAQQGLQQASGCMNSYGCPMGHVCLIPNGSNTGTCMKPN